MTRSLTLPLVGLLALALLAGPASAIYLVTPLRLASSAQTAEVGDSVTFTVSPENESMAQAWAGKTVRVGYSWFPNETDATRDGDAPTSSEDPEAQPERRVLRDALTLDAGANATFTWVVPEEVRDRNVDVYLEGEDGERVGFAWLGIGQAPPQMRILAGSGPAEPGEQVQQDDVVAEPGPDAQQDEPASTVDGNDTPAPALVAALGVVLLAALALRRRG